MKPLVIYHADCTDGFGAAFAAWLKLGDEAEYLPMQYGQSFTYITEIAATNCEVYILDFSFPRDVMDTIFKHAKRVVWLDHHKTAFEMYGLSLDEIHFAEAIHSNNIHDRVVLDNSKSGALLAWEYFHPGTHIPMLIRHIDDRDRWQFKMEGSKELHAALGSYKPWSFINWNSDFLDADGTYDTRVDTYHKLIREGAAILRAQDQHVASMAKQARKCCLGHHDIGRTTFSINGHTGERTDGIPAVTYCVGLACNATLHMSELGHVLATQSGTYGLIYYIGADNRVKCSLRSNGDYDVSVIAKAFGGGGHRNAAGFETDIDTLMGWLK